MPGLPSRPLPRVGMPARILHLGTGVRSTCSAAVRRPTPARGVDRLVVGLTSTDLNEQFPQFEAFATFTACAADRLVPERREPLQAQGSRERMRLYDRGASTIRESCG